MLKRVPADIKKIAMLKRFIADEDTPTSSYPAQCNHHGGNHARPSGCFVSPPALSESCKSPISLGAPQDGKKDDEPPGGDRRLAAS